MCYDGLVVLHALLRRRLAVQKRGLIARGCTQSRRFGTIVAASVTVWLASAAVTQAAAPVTGVFSVDGVRLRNFPTIAAGSSVVSGDLDADGVPEIIAGSPPGVRAQVTVYALDGTLIRRIYPYGAGVKTGVNVAVGDVAGDGLPQIVVAPRRGVGPRVLLFNADGRQLTPGFWAYAKKFGSGVNIAVGNLLGEGREEIVTGVGPEGRPHLSILRNDGTRRRNIFPYDLSMRNGLAVTTVDFDGNGLYEVVVAPQRGVADIEVVDPLSGTVRSTFRAFGNFRGGVSVAGFRADAAARLVVGAGRGGGPDIKVYDPVTGQLVGNHFFAFDASWRGGVTVATVDVDQDGQEDIIAVPGAPTLSARDLASFERSYVEPTVAGASYDALNLAAATGFFNVKVIRVNLDAPNLRVLTVTSTPGDCADDCPVYPLQYYVDQAGGFAGVNGGYFCPASQGSCVWKRNTYFWLWYNSLTGTFVNMAQNQFNTDPVIAFAGQNVPYLIPESRDFTTRESFESVANAPLTALLSNGPLLVQDGAYAVSSDKIDSQQRTMKTTRVGIGVDGRTLVMFTASRATVRDLGYIGVALGLDYAVNLDGGSSTSLTFSNRYKAGPGRNVPTAIVLSAR